MSFQNLYIKNISMKNYLIETLHYCLLYEDKYIHEKLFQILTLVTILGIET